MDIYTAINTRRTIRSFADKEIEMPVIEKIIEAGLQAPTNDHMRSWEFVVVQDKETRAKMIHGILDAIPTQEEGISRWLDSRGFSDKLQRDMYLEAMPKQYEMLYNAGCLIVPLFKQATPLLEPKNLSALNGFASIWCCIENILLAAAAEGIFGVTRIPIGNEAEQVKEVLNIHENYAMPCYIALGYPAKGAVINGQKQIDVRERIHIDTWQK